MEDAVEDKKAALAVDIDLELYFTFANWVEGSPNTLNWLVVIVGGECAVSLKDRPVWCRMDRIVRV